MIESRFGLADFNKQLESIKSDLRRKAVRTATNAAATVMRKASEQEAPVSSRPHMLAGKRVVLPGYMKSQVYQYRAKSPEGEEKYKVSVRGGRSARVVKKTGAIKDAYYWVWVHEGHTTGGKIKGGRRRAALERTRRESAGKSVQPNPFFTRAFQKSAQQAIAAFEKRIGQAIRRYQKAK